MEMGEGGKIKGGSLIVTRDIIISSLLCFVVVTIIAFFGLFGFPFFAWKRVGKRGKGGWNAFLLMCPTPSQPHSYLFRVTVRVDEGI